MAFVMLGHQRSGTSYLLDVIRHHPRVDTINEPFSLHLEIFREDEAPWKAADYAPDVLHPALADAPETVEFIRGLDRWLNLPFPHLRGFKETALFEKFDWLRRAVKFDRVLVVVRDPRAAVESLLRRRMHRERWDYAARLSDFYADEIRRDGWPASDAVLCARLWRYRMRHLRRIAEAADAITVRLEDFVSAPHDTARRMMGHLGLDLHREQMDFIAATREDTLDSTYSNVRRAEDVVDAWTRRLVGDERADVQREVRDELRCFGYV